MNNIQTFNQAPTPGGIAAIQLYEGLLNIAEDKETIALYREKALQIAQEIIAADRELGMLKLPATGENVVAWIESLPTQEPPKPHARFIKDLQNLIIDGPRQNRSEFEKIADVFEALMERKSVAPLVSQKVSKNVAIKEPKTVWEALCACPLIFV
ncbi:hypothetical protein IT418_01815 [bacterium]|nr:hypothetical protein [bacterium]